MNEHSLIGYGMEWAPLYVQIGIILACLAGCIIIALGVYLITKNENKSRDTQSKIR